ncbi:MAG: divalent-cation tolerance protein CutA [Proteobacteria bacterium]|nr:divalent-cation tolerance protein CutA [Pseudomonadota bacterium]MBU1610811.1 divalent-cation tolerance protein CutA [Pseudomonadota bacterium]
MSCSLVYITTPDLACAEGLGAMLVEQRLAACANILPGMRSIYRWQGAIERADEVVLLVKTKTSLLETLTAAVVAAHPYETPCVVSWPLTSGHPDFLKWIADETA